jgi:hypothetical protein
MELSHQLDDTHCERDYGFRKLAMISLRRIVLSILPSPRHSILQASWRRDFPFNYALAIGGCLSCYGPSGSLSNALAIEKEPSPFAGSPGYETWFAPCRCAMTFVAVIPGIFLFLSRRRPAGKSLFFLGRRIWSMRRNDDSTP